MQEPGAVVLELHGGYHVFAPTSPLMWNLRTSATVLGFALSLQSCKRQKKRRLNREAPNNAGCDKIAYKQMFCHSSQLLLFAASLQRQSESHGGVLASSLCAIGLRSFRRSATPTELLSLNSRYLCWLPS